ncbi:MAG: 16S rRNA (cytidine(1402)-2'-O)-methyltransferase [Phyllobacterium sp.]
MSESAGETTRSYLIGTHEYRARPLEAALYIVATPIGNLGDITIRALETLAAADILACEDTRTTRVLLDRFGIKRRSVAYHEHNAAEAGPKLLVAVQEGKSVALVSDAGTPLVSDPGFRLVSEAQALGVRVVPVPGASAVLAALAASGLPTDSFLFDGFLPSRKGQRRARLEALASLDATLVFFESPNRAAATLADMAEVLGSSRQAALCRELTKAYETVVPATLSQLAEQFDGEDRIRGEVVLVVGPPDKSAAAPHIEDIDGLLLALAAEMPASKAAAEAARMTGQPKSTLFQRLVQLKDTQGKA